MSAATFVDTSILVTALDPGDPLQMAAVDRLEVERASGMPSVSTNVLGELYVALTKKRKTSGSLLSHEDASDRLRTASELNVIAVQREHVLEAVRLRARHQLQWWDALNIASAKAASCSVFLTRDAQSANVIEGLRIEVLAGAGEPEPLGRETAARGERRQSQPRRSSR